MQTSKSGQVMAPSTVQIQPEAFNTTFPVD